MFSENFEILKIMSHFHIKCSRRGALHVYKLLELIFLINLYFKRFKRNEKQYLAFFITPHSTKLSDEIL